MSEHKIVEDTSLESRCSLRHGMLLFLLALLFEDGINSCVYAFHKRGRDDLLMSIGGVSSGKLLMFEDVKGC